MSDPFAPHAAHNLEASTAMTSVGEEAMNKTGGEAARLVKAAVSSKTRKLGRKGKPPAPAAYTPHPMSTFVPAYAASAVPESEAFPKTVVEADTAPLSEIEETPAAPAPDAAEHHADGAPAGLGLAVGEPFAQEGTDQIEEPVLLENHVIEEMNEPVMAGVSATPEGGERASDAVETEVGAIIDAGNAYAIAATHAVTRDAGTVFGSVAEVAADGEVVVTPPDADAAATGSALAGDAEVMLELGEKVVRRIQGDIDSSIAFWISMMRVKSPAEAIELNTAHVRHQIKSFVSQCEDLGEWARGPWMAPWRLWTGARSGQR